MARIYTSGCFWTISHPTIWSRNSNLASVCSHVWNKFSPWLRCKFHNCLFCFSFKTGFVYPACQRLCPLRIQATDIYGVEACYMLHSKHVRVTNSDLSSNLLTLDVHFRNELFCWTIKGGIPYRYKMHCTVTITGTLGRSFFLMYNNLNNN